MSYELRIYSPNSGGPILTPQTVVAAFNAAGLPCVEQPDKYGHWLVLEGFESALDLTLKAGFVIKANFRHVERDDPKIIPKVVAVFKGLGWYVADNEGNL
jgi:hypothetical protein